MQAMALRDRRAANRFFQVLVLATPLAASACGIGQQISAGPVFGGQNGSDLVLHCRPCFTASVALGWRWGGAGELYLTPKVGVLNGESKPYPFSHVPD
jgi:hypothetical protein